MVLLRHDDRFGTFLNCLSSKGGTFGTKAMNRITSLMLGAAAVVISAGWISNAADVDKAGRYTDHHPKYAAACERALAQLAEPEHNTWKNRLAAWKCHKA